MALLSQARKSERGMAQMSSCIAGFNVLNMRYVRTTTENQGLSQIGVIFIAAAADLVDLADGFAKFAEGVANLERQNHCQKLAS